MVKNDDFGPADLPQVHRLAGGLGGERVLHQPLPNDLPGDGAVFKIAENAELHYRVKIMPNINIFINKISKLGQKYIIPRHWGCPRPSWCWPQPTPSISKHSSPQKALRIFCLV